jgi:selenocysteine lyase/cysteine desulfurase
MKDAGPVQERLKRARVNARIGQHFIRLSPSVFNDMADIDRLLEALGG